MPTPMLKKQTATTRATLKGQGGPPRSQFDRNKYSQAGLRQRTQEAFDKKDSSGRFGSFIKDEYLSKLWECVPGEHQIDIIPYLVGPDHPTLQEGEPAFLLDVYRHANIGPNADSFICLSRMFNKPCPVCEDQREKRRSGEYSDKDLWALSPSRRTLYNIWVHDTEKEQAKGTILWEVAQKYFDKYINTKSEKIKNKTGEPIIYADPIIGKAISFERQGTKLETEYIDHAFQDRDYEIPDEILQQAVSLDQIIKIPTYEEVYQAHFGGQAKPKDQEETDVPMARIPSKLAKPKEETPPPDEEGCPYGGNIGVDINKYEECNECPKWDDCSEAEKAIKEQEELDKAKANKPPLTRRLGVRK